MSNDKLKPCPFIDLNVGQWFKWGKYTCSKTYEKTPNEKQRNNATGIVVETLDHRITPRDSVWVCSFDDDTIVTPIDLELHDTRTPDTRVTRALESIKNIMYVIDGVDEVRIEPLIQDLKYIKLILEGDD